MVLTFECVDEIIKRNFFKWKSLSIAFQCRSVYFVITLVLTFMSVDEILQ